MPTILKIFCQDPVEGTREFAKVNRIANELLAHLNTQQVQSEITGVNQPGLSSRMVQETFLAQARVLGFLDESKGLFAAYESALRPDYFLKLGDDSGILLEVERGKTTINNMDLLDFWKCHLCHHADYLFLMVPQELRQNATMSPRREFTTVVRRLATFFEPRNYTNVKALFVYGY